ncbi:MAG: NUDIX domain-containing protein [Candidatus Omnitrophica bacterium]|nr:NUDIX domain-containing protein [Candidatus Omnitrophota bacterium]
MPIERSAGAVIFRKEAKKILYLLLHYEEGHWDFPKGHIEKGEKTEETIRREVREETGMTQLTFIPGFKETVRYFFQVGRKRIIKFVVYTLAESSQKDVQLSFEHVDSLWLPFKEAKDRITFATSRKLLEKADAHLNLKH